MAGPATTRVMADFGATVIRLESLRHLDVARTIGPFVNDTPGNDSSGLLFNMTTGKRSVGLDLTLPESPRRARGPRAVGRRRGRVVLPSGAGGAGHRLRATGRAQPRPRHDVELPVRPDRAAAALRRVRHDGRLAGRLLPPHRLARPAAVRAVRRLQRLHVAALRPVRAARRPRPSPPHGRGPVPRLRPGRGGVHFLTPVLLDFVGQRPRRHPQRQHRRDHGAPRRVPVAGDDQLDRPRLPRATPSGRALAGAIGPPRPRRPHARRAPGARAELDGLVAAWTAGRPGLDATRRADRPRACPPTSCRTRSSAPSTRSCSTKSTSWPCPTPSTARSSARAPRTTLSATPAVVAGVPPLLGQDTVDVLTEVLGTTTSAWGSSSPPAPWTRSSSPTRRLADSPIDAPR